MPVIRISEQHEDMVEEIQEEHELHVTKKSIVERAVEDRYNKL